MNPHYDIIVIGGGHAGCEAAHVAAMLSAKTLLVSIDIGKLAQMSCNPAIGGIAKGQIVREIDALGGMTGQITDSASLQFRLLNQSKGPAMWSPRSQCDRMVFSSNWRIALEALPNLHLCQDTVVSLLISDSTVYGVTTQTGVTYTAGAVVITAGTFLSGLIHVGTSSFAGGRIGEPSSYGVTQQLQQLGIESGRMKTGTPVRIDGRSVDLSRLVEQAGDTVQRTFSFLNRCSTLKQLSCYIAHTNSRVHRLLEEGFHLSPLLQGVIKGIGPRYCPSIEDKIRTFSHRDSHQLFLEPEAESSYEMYLNGFSSSLPADVQIRALKAIEGFENAHVIRPGYAIEYDYFPPTQLHHSMESKVISSLFFAGQVNGTTGYEEAAAQGLVAGINAVLKLRGSDPLVLTRDQAYIGVLIDDLVTKGVDEPYRMFTSRAEHRILLRQDNADERLTTVAIALGTATDERIRKFTEKASTKRTIIELFRNESITPQQVNPYLESLGSATITQARKIVDIALRPEVHVHALHAILPNLQAATSTYTQPVDELLESVEIAIKYQGYISRESELASKIARLNHIKIPPTINYSLLNSISTEARQKLSKVQPTTIGQAQRIPGVSPSDINVLLVYLGR